MSTRYIRSGMCHCFFRFVFILTTAAGGCHGTVFAADDVSLLQPEAWLLEDVTDAGVGLPGSTAVAGDAREAPGVGEAVEELRHEALLRLGRRARDLGNLGEAESYYIRFLESGLSGEEKAEAMLELVDLYEARGSYGRAYNLVEQFLNIVPEDPRRVEALYRGGLLLARLGLREQAITAHYRVLNLMMTLSESQVDEYRVFARLAQYEIARNHYYEGDYDRALVLFERVGLFALEPGDRETVRYYTVLALHRGERTQRALRETDDFADDYPESDFLPELLYLQAKALYGLGREDEANEALFRLLDRGENEEGGGQADLWRRRAGNQFANRFYQDGDYRSALRLYQAILPLSEDPRWALPIVYQIGLCFERLGRNDRAAEAYAYLNARMDGPSGPEDIERLDQLAAAARWRLEALEWRQEMERRIERMRDG